MNLKLEEIIRLSLKEDIGQGDITTKVLVHAKQKVQANIILKQKGVICGLKIIQKVFYQVDPTLTFRPIVREGQLLKPNTILAHVYGHAASILKAERVALNFLSMLSGIATKTREFVEAVKPYQVKILDTRKTTPMLRELQRYAVLCGGGENHRFDLASMTMIKDNHLQLIKNNSTLVEAIQKIRKHYPAKKIELEVDRLKEFDAALLTLVDIILLDNMTPLQIRQAVRKRNTLKSHITLEASGGINLSNVKSYAKTGVERISIGSLTHNIQSLDISLDIAYKA